MTNITDPRLARIVYGSTRDGILIADADNRIIDVNPAFTRITGYRPEEVLGQSPSLLKSGRHDDAFYRAIWESLRQTGSWQGEIWDRRKNGDICLEILTITAVKDETGKVGRYIAVYTDIGRGQALPNALAPVAAVPRPAAVSQTRLTDKLAEAIAQADRDNLLLAVICLDLDRFKSVNDRYGDAVGDYLLLETAIRLRKTLRAVDTVARIADTDTRPGDTVARTGGDEFVLIVTGLPNLDVLEQFTQRLLKLVAQPSLVDGHELALTASLGITVYPLDAADPGALLRHADQAMYQAKESGRNRYHLFDTERDQQAHSRRLLVRRLHSALADDALELYYQPKVNLRTGKVIGLEALLRWRHPEEGLLPPAEFLPQVEHDDLIVEIGEWVAGTALRQLSSWRRQGLTTKVSINVAARQLLRGDFCDRLRDRLRQFPEIPPGSLELEILESSAIGNTAHVRAIMEDCHGLGISFALDDFGAGYASLSYLRDIPADVLKIDQSFIRDILDNADDLALVEGIVGLANAFRRIVVAEGVETTEQGVLLMRLGCDLAQGNGIAPPLPAARVPGWIDGFKPDPQWALWADTQWEMEDFPLLVAQYDHLNWVRRVAMHIGGGLQKLSKTELTDKRQCRFGHWYYGHGMTRYGHLPPFRELEAIHARVHEVGPEVLRLRAAGQVEAAHVRMRELLTLKDAMLSGLAKLQTLVAHKPH